MASVTKIRNFLSQPYHFYYEGKTFLTLLGLLFVMAMAFNLLFEPFSSACNGSMPGAFVFLPGDACISRSTGQLDGRK